MGKNIVNGMVAVVAIVGVVILVLRDANPNTLVLAVMMIANALGIGYNNNKTATTADAVQTVAEHTNGTLTALTDAVNTHIPAMASDMNDVKEQVEKLGQQ